MPMLSGNGDYIPGLIFFLRNLIMYFLIYINNK